MEVEAVEEDLVVLVEVENALMRCRSASFSLEASSAI